VNSYSNRENVEAWDQLYGKSSSRIWGQSPLPFIGEWKESLRDYLGSGARILDAGTGEGRNLPVFLELNGILWGCDASTHALERITDLLKSRVSIKCCELSETGFPDGFFNLIAMMDVFETLPCLSEALKEMNRILDANGYLFVNIPDSRDSIYANDMIALSDGGYLYAGRYYYHFYSQTEAVNLLKNAGFELVAEKLHSWVEEPHENYRDQPHEHTSSVFLFKKIMTS